MSDCRFAFATPYASVREGSDRLGLGLGFVRDGLHVIGGPFRRAFGLRLLPPRIPPPLSLEGREPLRLPGRVTRPVYGRRGLPLVSPAGWPLAPRPTRAPARPLALSGFRGLASA